jgi:signal transduction histidine kinase
VLTRQWIADCGGIFVARNSNGAKNINYFFYERINTPKGVYQRFTPAMVTKKLSNYSLKENLYSFHLASLHPMNPLNSPNFMDKMALHFIIKQGREELYLFEDTPDGQVFRYWIPLYVDNACLRCHANQGFTAGTIGGCLAIKFPAERLKATLRTDHWRMAGAGFTVLTFTTFILFFLLKWMVIKPLNKLKVMASEISAGNLESRVDLGTMDEFEQLGKVFNAMGDSLATNHKRMEIEIAQATREVSQANRELKKMDKIKTDFFADMSHEMRSPITAIKGAVDYLKRTINDEDRQNYVQIIDKNGNRLHNLISDLFDLTKIEAGKAGWQLEQGDLSELIKEVIEILGLQANEKNLSINYYGKGPVEVVMDPERIEQVLVNLCDNAIKFSLPGSDIDIRVEDLHDEVEVSVSDHGIGFAKENTKHIFEKFHTLPSSGGNGQTKGTGLGLTICKKIIEAHGGRIWAESVEGEGSVFTFRLPKRHPRPH